MRDDVCDDDSSVLYDTRALPVHERIKTLAQLVHHIAARLILAHFARYLVCDFDEASLDRFFFDFVGVFFHIQDRVCTDDLAHHVLVKFAPKLGF